MEVFKGKRTGLEITGKVRLDDMGFEDIDMFWASDGHRAVSHIGVETDDDDADDDNASFNYDTSNSITESLDSDDGELSADDNDRLVNGNRGNSSEALTASAISQSHSSGGRVSHVQSAVKSLSTANSSRESLGTFNSSFLSNGNESLGLEDSINSTATTLAQSIRVGTDAPRPSIAAESEARGVFGSRTPPPVFNGTPSTIHSVMSDLSTSMGLPSGAQASAAASASALTRGRFSPPAIAMSPLDQLANSDEGLTIDDGDDDGDGDGDEEGSLDQELRHRPSPLPSPSLPLGKISSTIIRPSPAFGNGDTANAVTGPNEVDAFVSEGGTKGKKVAAKGTSANGDATESSARPHGKAPAPPVVSTRSTADNDIGTGTKKRRSSTSSKGQSQGQGKGDKGSRSSKGTNSSGSWGVAGDGELEGASSSAASGDDVDTDDFEGLSEGAQASASAKGGSSAKAKAIAAVRARWSISSERSTANIMDSTSDFDIDAPAGSMASSSSSGGRKKLVAKKDKGSGDLTAKGGKGNSKSREDVHVDEAGGDRQRLGLLKSGDRDKEKRKSTAQRRVSFGADQYHTEKDHEDEEEIGGVPDNSRALVGDLDDYGTQRGDDGADFAVEHEGFNDFGSPAGGGSGDRGLGRARGTSDRSSIASAATSPSAASFKSTPQSSRSDRSAMSTPGSSALSTPGSYAMSTPGSNDFPRGRVVTDDSYVQDEDLADTESENDDPDETGFTNTSYLESARKRAQRGSDDEEEHDGDDRERGTHIVTPYGQDDDSDEAQRVRRSRRIKRQPLAFWKGEKYVYERGDLIGVFEADPTPVKPKRRLTKGPKKSKSSSSSSSSSADVKRRKVDLDKEADRNDGEVNFDEVDMRGRQLSRDVDAPIVLPQDVGFMSRDSDEMKVWDDETGDLKMAKVLCYTESLYPPSSLPITAPRKNNNQKVGYAAQFFNIPHVPAVMSGWIAGYVELPPGAIKDEEAVGECAQVFFVGDCQDGAVEMGIADAATEAWVDELAQRQLLKKGDSFFVPPGNIYRLENHSSTKSCTLFWTIIKPLETPEEDIDVQQPEDE